MRQNRLNDLLESANTIRPITDVMLGLSVARIIGLWAAESEMGAWQSALMPRRGYGLQPGVDASATLGLLRKPFSTAKRLRHFAST